jgi:DNA/RNA-binding domain of Phe-tRNA-synthetase-like protein
MEEISISSRVKEKLSDLVLGVIDAEVKNEPFNPELWKEMQEVYTSVKVGLSEVSSHSEIVASRKAYKACGKDPARYRLSAEALMRRIVKGVDLPQVNTVVDLLNLVSIKTGLSIGGYDKEKILGKILMDIGLRTDEYEAIGRGKFNIENLPALRDELSAFGSPTSDSERTSITLNTKRFLMVIFGFSGENKTVEAMEKSCDLLKKYALNGKIESYLVR